MAWVAVLSMSAGKPPLTICVVISSISVWEESHSTASPLSNCPRDTVARERPNSCHDMVRISTTVNLPDPECNFARSSGLDEPVRINCPTFLRASTSWRTWSQILGITCHSSINRGVAPSRSFPGATSKVKCTLSSRSAWSTLCETWLAVSVFPQAFGPRISTAPEASSLRRNSKSAILGI